MTIKRKLLIALLLCYAVHSSAQTLEIRGMVIPFYYGLGYHIPVKVGVGLTYNHRLGLSLDQSITRGEGFLASYSATRITNVLTTKYFLGKRRASFIGISAHKRKYRLREEDYSILNESNADENGKGISCCFGQRLKVIRRLGLEVTTGFGFENYSYLRTHRYQGINSSKMLYTESSGNKWIPYFKFNLIFYYRVF